MPPGDLLKTRKEIKKAVFASFDQAIDDSCASFSRVFLQLLVAIYNNPNNFLAKLLWNNNTKLDSENEFGRQILAYIERDSHVTRSIQCG